MKFIILYIAAISLSSAASSNVRKTKFMPEGRISRSRNATEGQFPYMVGLALQSDPESVHAYKCGGSLIGNEWILTAAQCAADMKQAIVLLGATDIQNPEVIYIVPSEHIIVHPGYNRVSLKNDIALIKIPFTNYTAKIKPVRLPSFNSTGTTFSRVLTVMTGWGGTTDDNSVEINHLKWAKFHTIENFFCSNGYGERITASNICIATGAGISPADGDSGGPLISLSTGAQIGIFSFGAMVGCQLGLPVVFTRITSFLGWIKGHTAISY